MSIERSIVQKLYESKGLYEASFEAGGSTYKCAFGRYYKDNEEITRDDYFKAKEEGGISSSSGPRYEDDRNSPYPDYDEEDYGGDIKFPGEEPEDDYNPSNIEYAEEETVPSKRKSSSVRKSSKKFEPVTDPAQAKDYIYNSLVHGVGGSKESPKRVSNAQNAIFKKYNIMGYMSKDSVDKLSDEDALAMWDEIQKAPNKGKGRPANQIGNPFY